MRTRHLALVLFALTACNRDAPGDGTSPTPVATVFPPPEQLVEEPTQPALPADGTTGGKRQPPTAVAKVIGPAGSPAEIRFVFDRPMQTFSGQRLLSELTPELSVSVVPDHPVQLRWPASDTLVVEPSRPWPQATEMTVRLAGAQTLDGATLATPVASSFVANPLQVLARAGTLMYPEVLESRGSITLAFNQPVAPMDLSNAVELLGAPSKEDLVAKRATVIPVAVEAAPEGNVLRLLPREPVAVGSWYELRVAASLRGTGPMALGAQWLGYYRGPEPLTVTEAMCGWPTCTAGDHWTVSFNGEVDPASFAGCFQVTPSIDLGVPEAQGWSVVLHPRGAKAGSSYRLVVTERCRDLAGQKLAHRFERTFKVEPPRAQLSMVTGTGYLPPSTDGGETRVKVSAAHTGGLVVGKARIDKQQLGAFLAANLESWGGLSFAKAEATSTTELAPKEDEADLGIALDDALRAGRGVVYLRVEAKKPGYDDEPPVRQALVQVTELGLTVKTGPQNTIVWVTSLLDHKPLVGVEVQMLDAKGATRWTQMTDERGLAVGPGTSGLDEGGTAERIVMASRGEDLAFVDLANWGTRTEAYEFGLPYAWDARADVLRGILFSERGVYRSGETVHFKGYTRVDKGGELEKLGAEKVSVRVTNPLGDRVLTAEVPLGAVGDFELDLPLSTSAPLGSWQIEAEAPGAASGSLVGTFRVEAYRPNTFEVVVDGLARRGDQLAAQARGRYYYGAPMIEAPVRWWVIASDASFAPAGYEDYTFEVPSGDDRWWEPTERSVSNVAQGDGVLDATGTLEIAAPIAALDLTQGPQQLTLEVEVTDVDAQVATGRSTLRLESADHYLGVKTTKRFGAINDPVGIDVVAVKPDGTPVAKAEAELTWTRRTWTSTRKPAAGGGMTWVSEVVETVVERRTISVTSDAARVLEVTPKQAGTYLVEVKGKDAHGHTMRARTEVWVWGEDASWADDDQGHLQIVAERGTWKLGETARFVVQSPFTSAQALVTVEKSGVLSRQVMQVTGSAPLIEIPVTKEMMPNAYVSVVLLGTPDATRGASDGAPEARMGYSRISIDTSEQALTVAVLPESTRYRPGDKVATKVRLTDAAGRPVAGQVAFMAVDEGVLSLTGYRTPDPHAALYRERPLAVSTSEARKSLWRRLAAEDGMKSDWGGGGEGGEATNYRSAFATTAAFLPDVEVGPSGEADVSFKLPDNLTTFRLMAVAASVDGRYGRGESKVEVSKPVTIRPGLPRFLSVGDTFDARAIVQTLDPELLGPDQGELAVELVVAGPVTLVGAGKTNLAASAKATPVAFKAKADAPGEATFAFKVTGRDGVSDAFELKVPVQWPAAERSAYMTGLLPASRESEQVELQIPSWVRDDVGGITIALSSSRLGELLPGLDYLLEYPYGCVEQTTGATLPLLALRELQSGFTLPGVPEAEVLKLAQAGLDRLRGMQTWSGGLSYWPGEETPHPWGSVYGGLALVTASKMSGLDVPAASLQRLSGYLKQVLTGEAAAGVDEWRSELEVVKPFAAWVLALAGTPEPSFHAQLFERRATLPDFARLLLALAIEEAHGDRTMSAALVDEVMKRVSIEGERADLKRDGDRYYYSTMDSDVRNQALLVLALERVRPDDAALPKLAYGLLEAREHGRWSNTQDNAFAILALARHFKRLEADSGAYTATVRVDGQTWAEERFDGKNLSSRKVELPMHVVRAAHGKKVVIQRQGTASPLYWSMRFDYSPREIPRYAASRGLSVERRYVVASGPRAGQPAREVEAGDLIRVELAVETATQRRYVAFDDPLPAGLEPVTLDFATTASNLEGLIPGEEPSWQASTFNHKEQRDDRVSLFSDWMPAGRHTHSYLARATTRGAFIAPAARAHEMYHPEVNGQSDALEVSVK